MTEGTLGGGVAGDDFIKEGKELPCCGGERMTDCVSCHVLRLIYSFLTSQRIYINRGEM